MKDKCRVIVSGNLEWCDELEQLYAPTATDKTKKMLFAIAVELGWHIRGLDIVGAFLGGELKTPVYVSPPKEFAGLDPDFCQFASLAHASYAFLSTIITQTNTHY